MDYTPADLEKLRSQWHYRGQERPPFAISPNKGQESVWDYPRPPSVVDSNRQVQVMLNNNLVVDSHNTVRVLETSSPPVFYLPRKEVNTTLLIPSPTTSLCEWKGVAHYCSLGMDKHTIADVAWYYPEPFEGYERLKDFIAFYPAKLVCYLDGIRVKPQRDPFYGGWITPDVVGPYKDEAPVS